MYCITDGAVIYSVGDTPEKALHDLREHGRVDSEVRDGYYRDGKLSLIEIEGTLYDRVLAVGGNLTFDIYGYGRNSMAIIPDEDNPE